VLVGDATHKAMPWVVEAGQYLILKYYIDDLGVPILTVHRGRLADPVITGYVTPVVYTVGTALNPSNTPYTSGTVTQFNIVPTLPHGLALHASTGAITGTPTTHAPVATYTITAAHSSGASTKVLTITVNDATPAVSYPTLPPAWGTFVVGQPMTSVTPTVTSGSNIVFTVDRPLPAGITLNASTGVISGTPSVAADPVQYTVRATNSGGTTPVLWGDDKHSATLVSIRDIAPIVVYPDATSAVLGERLEVVPTISAEGGQATAWIHASSSAMPSTLTLDTSTGMIVGTPVAFLRPSGYNITASNASGSMSNAHVNLGVTVFNTEDVVISCTLGVPCASRGLASSVYDQLTSIRLTGGHAWMNVDSHGRIFGTPTMFAGDTVVQIVGEHRVDGCTVTSRDIVVTTLRYAYAPPDVAARTSRPDPTTPTLAGAHFIDPSPDIALALDVSGDGIVSWPSATPPAGLTATVRAVAPDGSIVTGYIAI
jgi:hypothetical protein